MKFVQWRRNKSFFCENRSLLLYNHFVHLNVHNMNLLTLRLLVYKHIVLGNRPKIKHSSSVDCGIELFKPPEDLGSLQVCNERKFVGFVFFVSDVISKVGFWLLYLTCAQLLDGSISLKFSMETRLESAKSFETLIDFLAFLVQKLW